jgi:Cdc6-like AAA superfamily ATPase
MNSTDFLAIKTLITNMAVVDREDKQKAIDILLECHTEFTNAVAEGNSTDPTSEHIQRLNAKFRENRAAAAVCIHAMKVHTMRKNPNVDPELIRKAEVASVELVVAEIVKKLSE